MCKTNLTALALAAACIFSAHAAEGEPPAARTVVATAGDVAGLRGLFGQSDVVLQPPASALPWAQATPSPQLDIARSVQAAMGFSREVGIARQRVLQAQAQVDQTRGFLLPSVTLRVSQGKEKSSPSSITDPATGAPKASDTHSRYDQSIAVKQPLYDRTTRADVDRREAGLAARDAELQTVAAGQFAAVVQAYVSLASSRLLATLATEQEQELDRLLTYVSKRAEAGAASASDQERVRARSLAARSAKLEQDGAQQAALVEFTRLTNVLPESLTLPVVDDLGVQPPASAGEALDLGLKNNPLLAALQKEIDAARFDERAASGRFLPRVDLELSHGQTKNAGGPVGWQRDARGVIAMSWALFNGGTDRAYARERTSRLVEAELKLDDQRRRITQELGAAYATLESTRARLVTGYKALSSLGEAQAAMRERMFAGNQSLLDLLDIIERHNQARVSLVTLHMQELTSVAQLAQLTGRAPRVTTGEDAGDTSLLSKLF